MFNTISNLFQYVVHFLRIMYYKIPPPPLKLIATENVEKRNLLYVRVRIDISQFKVALYIYNSQEMNSIFEEI